MRCTGIIPASASTEAPDDHHTPDDRRHEAPLPFMLSGGKKYTPPGEQISRPIP